MEQTANTGGFIREFGPEKMSFASIRERDVALAIDQLNFRPRKSLNLITSDEFFMKQLL
jgi:IS30 family transposase